MVLLSEVSPRWSCPCSAAEAELACLKLDGASVVDINASSVGNIFYLVSDGRALRPSLRGDILSEELWRNATGLQIWGASLKVHRCRKH